jgi:Protein of unknown function (DUF732)
MPAIHRTIAVVTVAAGVAVFGGPAFAHAQTQDQQFAADVAALEIPLGADTDLPALGHGICDTLTGGLAGNPNPVPVVRGVVNRLENGGLTRQQAARLLRAAVSVYCPQHARYLGR